MKSIKVYIKLFLQFFFNLIPPKVLGIIIARNKNLTFFLNDNKNIVIRIDNQFFGKCLFSANTSFKIDKEILYRHYYDLKLLKYLKRLVKKGDYCFDIGANVGAITLPLSNLVGKDGKVFSFEPGPILFDRLNENVSINHFQNIRCFNYGLSDKNGKMFWSLDEINPGNAFLSNNGSIEVSIKKLDEVIGDFNINKVDLIKIDVEGMELEVLTGAYNILSQYTPTIIYETLIEEHYDKIDKLQKYLLELGYSFYEIDISYLLLTLEKDTFSFIPTIFPNLPQNTLAVHQSKLHILRNESLYPIKVVL